ncbi:MAG: class I SAM-dependent methyltransferase [Candidatus Aenigmatarchaeota archaeon]
MTQGYSDTFSDREVYQLQRFNELTNQEVVLRHIFYRISRMNGASEISHLDIGCGDLSFTRKFLDGLNKYFLTVYSDCIDSSNDMIKRASQFDCDESRITLYNSSFEDFEFSKKYDIVTAFHSWYGISIKYLQKFYDSIADGGLGSVVLSDKDSCELEIQRLVFPELIDADMAMGFFDRSEIRYKYSGSKISCPEDVLLKDGQLTDDALLISEFLHHKPLVEDMKDYVKSILRKNTKNGVIHISSHGTVIIEK